MSLVDHVPQEFSVARVQGSDQPLRFYDSNKVTFIWGESCCGQKKNGPQTAPPIVCSDEFQELIAQQGWSISIERCLQQFCPTHEKTTLFEPCTVAATCRKVAEASNKAVAGNQFPLLIGGDHCLAMGSVFAAAKRHPDLRVLWFDAHADVNIPAGSPSGNMHGMPLAALLGLDGMKGAPGFSDGEFTCLKPEQIAYIGLRDVDEGEFETLKRLGVPAAFDMADLQDHGIAALTKMALDLVNPDRKYPMHISFDVDGMDPVDAPSTGTPVPGGVRLHEALEMIKIVRDSGLLASFDCVEVNPSLGTPADVDLTVHNARWAIATALGVAPGFEGQTTQRLFASPPPGLGHRRDETAEGDAEGDKTK